MRYFSWLPAALRCSKARAMQFCTKFGVNGKFKQETFKPREGLTVLRQYILIQPFLVTKNKREIISLSLSWRCIKSNRRLHYFGVSTALQWGKRGKAIDITAKKHTSLGRVNCNFRLTLVKSFRRFWKVFRLPIKSYKLYFCLRREYVCFTSL